MGDLGKTFNECISKAGHGTGPTYSQCIAALETKQFDQNDPTVAEITAPKANTAAGQERVSVNRGDIQFEKAMSLVRTGGMLMKAVSDFDPRDYVRSVKIANNLAGDNPKRVSQLLKDTENGEDLYTAASNLVEKGRLGPAQDAIQLAKELEYKRLDVEIKNPAPVSPSSQLER